MSGKVSWAAGRLLLLAALSAFPTAVGAAPSPDWARVERLDAGRNLIVVRTGGEAVRGALSSTAADSVTLRTAGGDLTIPRQDVLEIRKPRSRARRAAEIAAIGAAVGIGIAAALLAATGGSDETAEIVTRGAAIGGAIGAAGGAAAAKERVLYRASASGN